jgi:hypothetical protein
MCTSKVATLLAACAMAVVMALPAEAQTRRASSDQGTVVVTRDENGRTRTRVIVSPRSYLDGGTEVLPGQRKFNFSDAQPYWSPVDVLGPGKNYDRQPLNPRWEQGWTRGNWN